MVEPHCTRASARRQNARKLGSLLSGESGFSESFLSALVLVLPQRSLLHARVTCRALCEAARDRQLLPGRMMQESWKEQSPATGSAVGAAIVQVVRRTIRIKGGIQVDFACVLRRDGVLTAFKFDTERAHFDPVWSSFSAQPNEYDRAHLLTVNSDFDPHYFPPSIHVLHTGAKMITNAGGALRLRSITDTRLNAGTIDPPEASLDKLERVFAARTSVVQSVRTFTINPFDANLYVCVHEDRTLARNFHLTETMDLPCAHLSESCGGVPPLVQFCTSGELLLVCHAPSEQGVALSVFEVHRWAGA